MLHEDDDPLSNSFFDTASSSFLGNTMTTSSIFASQYEEDPWGNSFVSSVPDISRSFSTPNFPPLANNTTSDASDFSPLTRKRAEYNASNVLSNIIYII